MAEAMKRYRVVYELDESGHWIATVARVKGCHTYGRSLSEARSRVREALSLFVNDSARAELADEIRLPADMRRLAERLSRRDAAELLDISHQRVQQLAEAEA